ncbi:MAG: cytochrome c biogenesis protein CcsA [Bacteroidetes bacterium]|nr:cytochrome c biogenesis protein CcsA [Bacteroidota bacterium]
MTYGILGFRLTDLAFVTAIVGAIAFYQAAQSRTGARQWFRLGKVAFLTHFASVTAVIGLLWALIFMRQYQYQYVYSHSSNELSTEFIIACLWEGQEGSFLIWMFWHGLLGIILLYTAGNWRPGVLAVVCSVEAILASMVLGVVVEAETARWLLLLLGLLLAGGLLWPMLSASRQAIRPAPEGIDWARLSRLATGIVLLAVVLNLLLGMSGQWLATGWMRTLPGWAIAILLLGYAFLLYKSFHTRRLPLPQLVLGFALLGLAYVLSVVQLNDFKIGSSPFLTLAQARPEDQFLQANPDFAPVNGTGLNALLQNYWMVIHPPTLFLGFAATLIPFAFVIAGLWSGRYKEWIDPASPWAILAIAILGVGIMMGGYWAYETLNFGGYWNWDPVENASLVPWLLGVGGLHAMLSYRKSGKNLRMAMLLMAATFVLVLYSTFLTRSGILGESSVHSFTDLGLSGQLLLLLFIYLGGMGLLFAHHWHRMPAEDKPTTLFSREFFLFLAAVVLTFTAIEISLVTSMPVINKIFGTRLAAPSEVQYFYYRWNVWFGILIALLSAVGQFFYWTRIEKASLLRAMNKPFLIAALTTAVVMVLLFLGEWEFAYQEKYREAFRQVSGMGLWEQIKTTVGTSLLVFADDILLFCALFSVFANGSIIWRLVRRSGRNLRHTGGSLAHIGFGLMLLGILFSSGYEDTISVNLNPGKLGGSFGDDAARKNVVLPRNQPVDVKQYRLVYRGRRPAQPPFSDFRILTATREYTKVAFRDKDGYRFALEVPSLLFSEDPVFRQAGSLKQVPREEAYNMAKIAWYIRLQHHLLEPEMVNKRALYGVDFYPLRKDAGGSVAIDTTGTFRLYPEAEPNGDQSLIPHPDRAIFWQRDLYAHVTGFPTGMEKTEERWTMVAPEAGLALNDSLVVDGVRITATQVERIPVPEGIGDSELLTQLHLRVQRGDSTWLVHPQLMINRVTGGLVWVDAWIPALNYRLRFSGVDTEADKFKVMVAERIPTQDYVILNVISKPWINLLWLGTLVMTLGFVMAIWRRSGELKKRIT